MSINRINVHGSSLPFSERKIFPLENGVWSGVGGGGLIKPPQLPGSAVPYSLLPISSLMNPLCTRGLNLRCNFYSPLSSSGLFSCLSDAFKWKNHFKLPHYVWKLKWKALNFHLPTFSDCLEYIKQICLRRCSYL